jgi:hypothetical protein
MIAASATTIMTSMSEKPATRARGAAGKRARPTLT